MVLIAVLECKPDLSTTELIICLTYKSNQSDPDRTSPTLIDSDSDRS